MVEERRSTCRDAGTPDRSPAGGSRPIAGARVLVLAALAAAVCGPAEAQRFGRRFRSAPPAPRAPASPGQPAGPRTPAPPRAVAPDAAPARRPATGAKDGTKDERPQTTGTSSRREGTPNVAPEAPRPAALSAAVAATWGEEVPFGASWRKRHPEAWNAESRDAAVTLAAATEEIPTAAERPAPSPDEEAAPRSVLASGEGPALLLFPPEDAVPAAPARPRAAGATDGTVSVLARDPDAVAREPEGALAATLAAEGTPEWLALGTFAALPPGSDETTAPHVFLEVFVHRDGSVRGNCYDALSDAVHALDGKMDKGTGTVSWRVGKGPEFSVPAEELAEGRAEATLRGRGSPRPWTLISLR